MIAERAAQRGAVEGVQLKYGGGYAPVQLERQLGVSGDEVVETRVAEDGTGRKSARGDVLAAAEWVVNGWRSTLKSDSE